MHTLLRSRRLPLEGTMNTRDLGGYPCDGGVTRWGTFLRSDSPHGLTDQDVDFLIAYGVANSIDLRSAEEQQRKPSILAQSSGFVTHHVSLSDRMPEGGYEGDIPGSMAGLYISMLDDHKDALVRVIQILATSQNGLFFHCAAGKDRTGVVSMLLLKLVGVDDADVIADYSITDIYMREILDKNLESYKKRNIPEYVILSLPDSMRRVLQHLHNHYGSAGEYLLAAGLLPQELERLRTKFIQHAS